MTGTTQVKVLDDFVARVVVEIINPLILLLAGVAFVVFLWGVFNYIWHAGDSTKRSDGHKAIGWGLVGFVVMFGAYGIINFALSTAGLENIKPLSGQ